MYYHIISDLSTDKVKPLLSKKCHTTQILVQNSILQCKIGSFMINYQTLTVDNCPNCISVSYKNIWIVHRLKNPNLLSNDAFSAGPATIFKICKNIYHEFYETRRKLGHCAIFKSFLYRKSFQRFKVKASVIYILELVFE